MLDARGRDATGVCACSEDIKLSMRRCMLPTDHCASSVSRADVYHDITRQRAITDSWA